MKQFNKDTERDTFKNSIVYQIEIFEREAIKPMIVMQYSNSFSVDEIWKDVTNRYKDHHIYIDVISK